MGASHFASGSHLISPITWLDSYRKRRKLVAARESGCGLYTQEWPLEGDGKALTEAIVDWCRDTLARSRRPYGIAHFDLALSVRHAGQQARKVHFRRREPLHLYTESSDLVTQIRELLTSESVRAAAGPVSVLVAISSWGDIAHAALVR